MRTEQGLPPRPDSVPRARSLVSSLLEQSGAPELSWPALQVMSELATNAVIHAGTTFVVEVGYDDGVLRLAVTDGNAHLPRIRHYGPTATTGRGLALVARLSDSWGVQPHEGGKRIWCEITAPNHRADAAPESEGDLLDAWPDLDPVGGQL